MAVKTNMTTEGGPSSVGTVRSVKIGQKLTPKGPASHSKTSADSGGGTKILKQLQRAKKNPDNGRTYLGTSQKAERKGNPLGYASNASANTKKSGVDNRPANSKKETANTNNSRRPAVAAKGGK